MSIGVYRRWAATSPVTCGRPPLRSTQQFRLAGPSGGHSGAVVPFVCALCTSLPELYLSVSFAELGVPEDLVRGLHARGIDSAFPIQAATLVDALAGHDVCGKAPTGSGKTLAFGIPVVSRVGQASSGRPKALILAPTRELAAQICEELTQLGSLRDCRVASFYGGVGFGPQLNALRRGVDIAVACPGRLMDLMDRGAIRLHDVETVVVDEADRMADMGFMPVVREILDQVSDKRQTLLFSATLDGDVKELIRRYQNNPKRYEVDTEEDAIGESAVHYFWKTSASERVELTTRIVRVHKAAMVFCRTKRGADRLVKHLKMSGLDVGAIHGDRSQAQRDQALEAFRSQRIQILVGTDVAARGIHVDGVDCVVHFDPPEDEKAYVHRSGRTGRAGAGGTVISLVTREHQGFTKKLQSRLGLSSAIDDPIEDILNAEPTFVKNTTRPHTPSRSADRGRDDRSSRPRNTRPSRPRNARPGRSSGEQTTRGGGAEWAPRNEWTPEGRTSAPRQDNDVRPQRQSEARPPRSNDDRRPRTNDDRPARPSGERPYRGNQEARPQRERTEWAPRSNSGDGARAGRPAGPGGARAGRPGESRPVRTGGGRPGGPVSGRPASRSFSGPKPRNGRPKGR